MQSVSQLAVQWGRPVNGKSPCLLLAAALGLCAAASAAAQPLISVTDCQAVRVFRSGSKGDRLGHAVTGAGDVNGDGFPDLFVGAPVHDTGSVSGEFDNGAAYLLFGSERMILSSNEIDVAHLGDRGVVFIGAVGARIGATLAGLGDVNEDGFADVAIGTGRGYQATVVFGSSSLPSLLRMSALPVENTLLLNTGASVAAAGDVNGDGLPDALFGNPYAELVTIDGKRQYLGKATVLFGSSRIAEVVDSNHPGDAGFTIRGPVSDQLGMVVCGVGDVNQDGFDEFVLAAPGGGKKHRGSSYLVLGTGKKRSPSEYRLVIEGGAHAAAGGDVNGDGFSDFLVCSRDYRALLVWGNRELPDLVDLNADVPPSLGTVFEGASVGGSAGDVNGDGLEDLVFGLPYQSPNGLSGAGQIVIILGAEKWPPVVDLLAPEVPHITINGVLAHGGFGTSVASIDDLDVDGYGDLVVGAPFDGQDADGNAREGGEAYVLSGDRITRFLSEGLTATLSQSP